MRSTVARHRRIHVMRRERFPAFSVPPSFVPKQRYAFNASARCAIIPTSMIQRLSFFSSKTNANVYSTPGTLEQNMQKARELLAEPRGTYTCSHVIQAKHVLDFFEKVKATDLDALNLSISLFERLVDEEVLMKEDGSQLKWTYKPRYFNPLFNHEEGAAKQGKHEVSPRDLVRRLQTMSNELPEFRLDLDTLAMIMDGAIKPGPPEKSPFRAEDLLTFLREDESLNELRPKADIYNKVIQAWAVSGLPEAPRKMEALLKTMGEERIITNEETYMILLRYWAKRARVDKVEAILETMEDPEGIHPSTTSLALVIECYVDAGNLEKAEECLEEMLKVQPNDEKETSQVVTESLFMAYRSILNDSNSHYEQKSKALQSAEALLEKTDKITTDEDHQSKFIMVTTMSESTMKKH